MGHSGDSNSDIGLSSQFPLPLSIPNPTSHQDSVTPGLDFQRIMTTLGGLRVQVMRILISEYFIRPA